MANNFAFPKPPLVQPVVDDNGSMDRNWQAWFQQVFAQIRIAAYIPSAVVITGGTITGISTLTATGVITGSNLSGTNTGDQSFTASGDVTAPASKTNLVMTIGANAVTYSKLQLAVGAALLGAATAGGAYREISLGKGLAFNGSSLQAESNTYDYTTPSTGFTYTIPNGVGAAIIDPAGTLSTGSITMPAAPSDGDVVCVASSQIITTLTMAANTGQTLKGGLTTIAANGFAKWQYVASKATWYRVG